MRRAGISSMFQRASADFREFRAESEWKAAKVPDVARFSIRLYSVLPFPIVYHREIRKTFAALDLESNIMATSKGNLPIVVLGAGPAGMATALGLIKAGHSVVVYERYPNARPAGSLLNLWPPPVKALAEMGVDINDLGASPDHMTFENANGTIRAVVRHPETVGKTYGEGFLGLLRPDLYSKMLAALPANTIRFNRHVVEIESHESHVSLTFSDGEVVETPVLIGADGIDSTVRKTLWGNGPKRLHNLHVVGGYTFDAAFDEYPNEAVVAHSAMVQGSFTPIRSQGRSGFQWWILTAWPDQEESPEDLHSYSTKLAAQFPARILPQLVAKTPKDQMQRWVIRDRKPIKSWSKGRITLAGDAAHPTSPYAAYGAGMSICDGYYLAQSLAGVDISNTADVHRTLHAYETARIPHTTFQVEQAYQLGQFFHHTPWYLRLIRDFVLDWSPFLQWQVGDRNPREISSQIEEMGDGILARS